MIDVTPDVQQMYDDAMDQAGADLVALPKRKRLRLYFGGATHCEIWTARRAAWLLAERLSAQGVDARDS